MVGKILNLGVDLFAERAIGTSSENPISQFKIGIGTTAPTGADTDLEIAVPISDGTANDDGSNTLTGSSGGDNTTNNTVTFKEGAGQLDVTSQNLIANSSNSTKIWTIANLAAAGSNITSSQFFGLWIFIKDSTALAKFKSSGTVLEIKLGSSTSDYFSLTKEASDLSVGFNWITSNTVAVNGLTETGTVTGNVDTFIIEITTNNASDTFVAGDVIYDLLRTWQASDLTKTFATGFPAYDTTTKQIQSRMILTLSLANGFPLTEILVRNTDGTGWTRDTFTSFSKSLTEELRLTSKDRITSN